MHFYFIFLKASILSSVLGCVENQLVFLFLFFLNGSAIYICAVALLAVFSSFGSLDIFCKAEINPSGFLVNSTAVASAKNSLLLDTAS